MCVLCENLLLQGFQVQVFALLSLSFSFLLLSHIKHTPPAFEIQNIFNLSSPHTRTVTDGCGLVSWNLCPFPHSFFFFLLSSPPCPVNPRVKTQQDSTRVHSNGDDGGDEATELLPDGFLDGTWRSEDQSTTSYDRRTFTDASHHHDVHRVRQSVWTQVHDGSQAV